MDARPPTDGQLAKNLPGPAVFVTGHNSAGKAVLHSERPASWGTYEDGAMQMAVAWTTDSFPVDVSRDQDLAAHDARMAAGSMGLVAPGGTVLRFVDFSPGYECMMHRTVSVDFGIVLEGEVISKLDSGTETHMRRGDVMVQRATMHSWKNPSASHWARMVFCLQDCQAPRVHGAVLGEDLGRGTPGIPASGNATAEAPAVPVEPAADPKL